MRTTYGSVLIFGGTTEGRTAAERLLFAGVPCTVSVATPYGEEVLAPHPLMTVRTGRLDRAGMAEMLREGHFSCVIDATHPHARVVSREIAAACGETGLPCLRLQRPEMKTSSDEKLPDEDVCIYVRDIDEAGRVLACVPGKILVTTGSKELGRFVKALGDVSRITARVLPSQESLRACTEAGLAGRQIVAMQGPFDLDMNCAQIRHTGAAWLLTKETGAAGGYPDKVEAVRKCGIRAVVIRRPPEDGDAGEGAGRAVSVGGCEGAGRAVSVGGCEGVGRAVSVGDGESVGYGPSIEAAAGGGSGERCGSLGNAGGIEGAGGRSSFSEIGRSQFYQRLGLEETIAAALAWAAQNGGARKRRLYLVGTGVGAREAATLEAQEALAAAQVLFGARTVLDNLTAGWKSVSGKTLVPLYDSAGILQYLNGHPEIRTAAAVYSGDSGFYSGAASLLAALRDKGKNAEASPEAVQAGSRGGTRAGQAVQPASDAVRADERGEGQAGQPLQSVLDSDGEPFDVRVICGISSVSWFAARVGIPWQSWKILSSHGRFCNVTGEVRRNRECFLLLSGAEDLQRTGALLADAQARGVLGELKLVYGYELSRPAEEIREVTPQALAEVENEGLYVLYVRHDAADRTPLLPGLPDSAFIRGKAPMTSAEIRALSLCRLGLTAKAVLWDVGAGTGSVSVEAALTCPEGKVWSVEFKEEALALLRENRAKFCLQNMEIVEGRAPEALKNLPAPTHVFIGGSGGEIGEILKLAFSRNPRAKVVVNCITSETLAALHTALASLPVQSLQCTQVLVNREEMLGRCHYLKAGNPVFIISFTG